MRIITWNICESLNLSIGTAEPVLLRQVVRCSLSWSRAWGSWFQLASLLFALTDRPVAITTGSGEDCGSWSRWAAVRHLFHFWSIHPERPEACHDDVDALFSFYIGYALSFPWRLPWLRKLNLETEFQRLIDELPLKRGKKWRAKLIMSIARGKQV